MKSLIIAGHVITNKAQAVNFAKELNHESCETWEAALAINQIQEKMVNAGFLTWEDIDTAW